MRMPQELSVPIQRILRTMISGVMLVQCFTLYVYLASYIVMLYPVFLEERPTLVLPWLLLAAVRKFLCELTSLALGLGTCVLLGPARPPCVKFVILKIASIMPAFYMWLLVYNYYNTLKVSTAFKTFTTAVSRDHDCGLELAVRRRKTKSLLGEEQLRKTLITNLYNGRNSIAMDNVSASRLKIETTSRLFHSTDSDIEIIDENSHVIRALSEASSNLANMSSNDGKLSNEITIPRDTDRILEQFVLMLLRIGTNINSKDDVIEKQSNLQLRDSILKSDINNSHAAMDDTETSALMGNEKGNTLSYIKEYPHIFKQNSFHMSGFNICSENIVNNGTKVNQNDKVAKSFKRRSKTNAGQNIKLELEKNFNKKETKTAHSAGVERNESKTQNGTTSHGYKHKDRDHSFTIEFDLEEQKQLLSRVLQSSSVDSLNLIIDEIKRRISRKSNCLKTEDLNAGIDSASQTTDSETVIKDINECLNFIKDSDTKKYKNGGK